MYNPQLEMFLRVADAGSFNKAAAQAYITPTAVIKQINALEAELELTLFERSHRGLRLTKAGVSLYQDAKYLIGYCRDAVTRARNAMQEDTQVIRIGTSPITPAQILVELWPKIHGRSFRISDKKLISWRGFSTKLCWGFTASAMGLRFPANRFAVRYRSTTVWRRKTG